MSPPLQQKGVVDKINNKRMREIDNWLMKNMEKEKN
jgi:hypothetical protein